MSDPIPGQLLGNILRDHDCLRLAVLNACEGARQSNQDPFSGVAQSLCQQRLPAVVAMQFEISDDAAKTFAEEFYGAIADGLPVDAAVSESRKALFSGRFGQEWATPVLYMRSSSGVLFEVQRRAKPAVEPKPSPQPDPKPQPAAAQPVQPAPQVPPVQPRSAPPPPPPVPPPQFRPGPTPLEQEAERRRREAERIKQDRALFDLEQARLKAERLKEEQRLKEERLRREQIEAQQRADQERARLEEARRRVEEQRLKDERARFEQQQAKHAEEQRQQEERLRREREAAANVARVPPPAPPPQPLRAAPPVVPPKKSHRARNIILGILGAIVLFFIIIMIIDVVSEQSRKSSSSTTTYAETPERHLLSGDQAMESENYDNAISEYNAAIAQNADYADAHSHLCNAIALKGENTPNRKGDYDAAVAQCEKAVQLAPNDAAAHSNLCNALDDQEYSALEMKGNFDHAISECRRAIQLNPNYAAAYNNLCNVIGNRSEQRIAHPNDRNEGIAACRKAIALQADYAEPHKNLADFYRLSGNDSQAKADAVSANRFFQMATAEYRNAVTIKPRYREAQVALGAILYQTNDPDNAIAELNKAAEVDSNYFETFYWLGNVYLYEKKDYGQAAENFRKSLTLKPDLDFAEYGLSVALRAQGNSVEADQHLTSAYRLNENDKNIAADYKKYISGEN
jgi:Flp pilus assembly protein TadD